MTFTEEDAQNNGLIKREVGQQLKKVASRDLRQLYEHFVEVCEHRGRDPADVFGENVVRALEDEGHADMLFETDVNLSKIQANEIREEDIEYVNKLADSLGLNGDEQVDPIEKAVMERINAATGTPLSGFSESVERGQQKAELKQHLESTMSRLDEIERKIEQSQQEREEAERQTETESEREFDEIWSGGDGQEQTEQEETDEPDAEEEIDFVEDVEEDEDEDFTVDEGQLSIDSTGDPDQDQENKEGDNVELVSSSEAEVDEDGS